MKRPLMPPAGQVTIWAEDRTPVTAMLGPTPEITYGAGGWEDHQRGAGYVPVATYKSRGLDAFTLELRLDIERTVRRGDTVEDDLARLLQLSRTSDLFPGDPPPLGVLGELPFSTSSPRRYRVDGDITVTKRRYQPGSRTKLKYIVLTVPFRELVVASMVEQTNTRRTRDNKGRRRVRPYKTKSGQTMRTIAVIELGDATRWRDLRTWNEKLKNTNPDAPLRPGTALVLK